MNEGEEKEKNTLRSVGFFDYAHTLSAVLSLERCLRRTSEKRGRRGGSGLPGRPGADSV